LRQKDIVIIGGGLAGLVAAFRLNDLGIACTLVDQSLPQARGKIGGFAKFSGAKFSLPPAGMGLLDLCESYEALEATIGKVTCLLGLERFEKHASIDHSKYFPNLRKYDSVVLTPTEINQVIAELEDRVEQTKTIQFIHGAAHVSSISDDKVDVEIVTAQGIEVFSAKTLIYAGGRQGAGNLSSLGLERTFVKGIDVGVRIEFSATSGLSELRKLGPDAKIIKDACRTFCLNVPGEIYRYPFENISIPGGIVAETDHEFHNVGILYRSPNKLELIDRVKRVAASLPSSILEKGYVVQNGVLGNSKSVLNDLYGASIVNELESFCHYLSTEGLINWDHEHIIYLPLIDWYWDTFSLHGTFKTSSESVYCIGDTSGHARGLLQAAMSGWLAAEEYRASI
jgi:thioredoxin reductase